MIPGMDSVTRAAAQAEKDALELAARGDELEIVGEDPADMPVVELFERGMLSKSDVDKLRHVVGALTFAEWIDSDQLTPFRIKDERLLAVCQLRHAAIADARLLARFAPHQLMPELMPEVQL